MELEAAIFVYFSAEKSGALLKFIFASAALLVSLYFFKTHEHAKGFTYVAAFIFLTQLVVGGTIFFRTDNQVVSLFAGLDTNSASTLSSEIKRMTQVSADFATYRAMQIFFIGLGAALFWLGRVRQRPQIFGAGIGFASLGGMLFFMDLIASKRADTYLEFIKNL